MNGAEWVASLTNAEREFYWKLYGAVENVAIEAGECTCRGWVWAVDDAIRKLSEAMLDAEPHGSSLRDHLNRPKATA